MMQKYCKTWNTSDLEPGEDAAADAAADASSRLDVVVSKPFSAAGITQCQSGSKPSEPQWCIMGSLDEPEGGSGSATAGPSCPAPPLTGAPSGVVRGPHDFNRWRFHRPISWPADSSPPWFQLWCNPVVSSVGGRGPPGLLGGPAAHSSDT